MHATLEDGVVGLWYGLALGVASGATLLLWLVLKLDWEREALAARAAAVSQNRGGGVGGVGGDGCGDDEEICLVEVSFSSSAPEAAPAAVGNGGSRGEGAPTAGVGAVSVNERE